MYDLASGDPDSTISKARRIRYVATGTRNGSIIVMHVNGRGWHTSEALPKIIQALRAKGFIFSKVSELLKTQKNAGRSSIERNYR
jgi:peptidoglycan/xylan/chitin deacetylase (PgdA/CDA1 family)